MARHKVRTTQACVMLVWVLALRRAMTKVNVSAGW
jgi:hypothetical protein